MNWRNFLLATVLGFSAISFAQSNLLNAKTPDEIGKKTQAELNADNDKPMPYGYVGDRDILMGKAVWEIIDINQRVNFPLGSDRKPLFEVLMSAIKEKKITEVYDSGYFTTKKTFEDIEKALSFKDTTDQAIELLNSGEKNIPEEFIVKYEIKAADVEGYKVKGYWYFDKRQGELKYRLLGICPRVPDVYTLKGNADKREYVDLFWIYFPAARDVLHSAKAFNERNSAMPFTFDHLLNARRFSGVIYLEENVYGDREIKDYMKENSQMQLLESERVKEKIRNFELDMWNY
ncbi:gliding motility protein GldN [Flavobacterium sp.]|uniref:type IX secretion system ring protein PorN/GldN n=1 Tax=Flavobacterium sp. TaxID=239 RepID=UPI0035B11220